MSSPANHKTGLALILEAAGHSVPRARLTALQAGSDRLGLLWSFAPPFFCSGSNHSSGRKPTVIYPLLS